MLPNADCDSTQTPLFTRNGGVLFLTQMGVYGGKGSMNNESTVTLLVKEIFMSMLVRSPRKNAAGFTLIELMIAIAIIGVLAALAVPAFSNYLARARISEAIQYAESCKTGYVEFYATRGVLPNSQADANCPSITTDNVAGVSVQNTAPPSIRVLLPKSVLPSQVQDHTIVLQPLAAGGVRLTQGATIVSWQCSLMKGNAAASQEALDFLPAICRNAQI